MRKKFYFLVCPKKYYKFRTNHQSSDLPVPDTRATKKRPTAHKYEQATTYRSAPPPRCVQSHPFEPKVVPTMAMKKTDLEKNKALKLTQSMKASSSQRFGKGATDTAAPRPARAPSHRAGARPGAVRLQAQCRVGCGPAEAGGRSSGRHDRPVDRATDGRPRATRAIRPKPAARSQPGCRAPAPCGPARVTPRAAAPTFRYAARPLGPGSPRLPPLTPPPENPASCRWRDSRGW